MMRIRQYSPMRRVSCCDFIVCLLILSELLNITSRKNLRKKKMGTKSPGAG